MRPERFAVGDFVTANDAALHVAYALSDNLFVYGSVENSNQLGWQARKWQASGEQNCFGHAVGVQELDVSRGAARIAHGAVAAGLRSTILTPSDALGDMYPALRRMSEQRRDIVLHVGAMRFCGGAQGEAIDPLTARSDLSDLFVACDSGLAMLLSGSCQEAHDMAVVAHLAARRASTPIAHAFDGVIAARHQTNDTHILPSAALSALLDGSVDKRGSSSSHGSVDGGNSSSNNAAATGSSSVKRHIVVAPTSSTVGSRLQSSDFEALTSSAAPRRLSALGVRSIAIGGSSSVNGRGTPGSPMQQSIGIGSPAKSGGVVFHRLSFGGNNSSPRDSASTTTSGNSTSDLAIRAALAVGPGGANSSLGGELRRRATADEIIEAVEWSLARVATLTGRRHAAVEYCGTVDADTIIVVPATADSVTLARVARRVGAVGAVGVLKVRPFFFSLSCCNNSISNRH